MTPTWPRARAVAGDRAVIKATAADFRVDELPSVIPAGEGEHLWLRLEKTERSTVEVARWLADAFHVPEHAVGYAGMKDKHAVTAQWFSVHTPDDAAVLPAVDGIRLLASARHRRKLRRGELAGNRFELRLREVVGDTWTEGLRALRDGGAPNYFGPQRFGSDNLANATAWLTGPHGRRRRLPAFRRGLYLSVLRSFLFNEVLADRVSAGTWRRLVAGDVPACGRDAAHPTGPLWGRGRSPATAEAGRVEEAALAPHGHIREGLEHAGLAQERRSLVLRAPDLEWAQTGAALTLSFTLPPGTYATALLGEAFALATLQAGGS